MSNTESLPKGCPPGNDQRLFDAIEGLSRLENSLRALRDEIAGHDTGFAEPQGDHAAPPLVDMLRHGPDWISGTRFRCDELVSEMRDLLYSWNVPERIHPLNHGHDEVGK